MSNQTINTITVAELIAKINSGDPVYLIDVRELDEWNEIRIPGAIHIPKDEITKKIESIVTDRSHPIYLHCRSGMRSMYAAEQLLTMGYEVLFNVEGGILAWKNMNYPTEP